MLFLLVVVSELTCPSNCKYNIKNAHITLTRNTHQDRNTHTQHTHTHTHITHTHTHTSHNPRRKQQRCHSLDTLMTNKKRKEPHIETTRIHSLPLLSSVPTIAQRSPNDRPPRPSTYAFSFLNVFQNHRGMSRQHLHCVQIRFLDQHQSVCGFPSIF